MKRKNIVSIVLAVRNEERIIEECLNSLLAQKLAENISLEIIVVDGISQDKTPEIVGVFSQRFPEKVKLIKNQKKITPVAFNLGIKSAEGDFIGILGAHTQYDSNYIQKCLDEISEKEIDGCSGVVITKMSNDSAEAELCNKLLSLPIGVSSSSFRTRKAGLAESIPYGVFKREVFEKVGAYNEKLIRNQDNDMNHRITKQGFKLYITDQTFAYYFPKQNLQSLLQYAFNTGFWNAKTLMYRSYSLKIIHFVPFFFVSYVISLPLFLVFFILINSTIFLFLFLLPIIFYFLLCLFYKNKVGFKYQVNRSRFVWALFRFHWSYGFGTILGFLNLRQKLTT